MNKRPLTATFLLGLLTLGAMLAMLSQSGSALGTSGTYRNDGKAQWFNRDSGQPGGIDRIKRLIQGGVNQEAKRRNRHTDRRPDRLLLR